MRTFSRHMPARECDTASPFAWSLLAALLAGWVALGIRHPLVLILPAAVFCLCWLETERWTRKQRRRIAGRTQDLCAFARSFDRQKTDPWIIRAVWDEFTDYMRGVHEAYPLQSTDRLNPDLGIEDEDLEYLIMDCADRAGYSLDDYHLNPNWAKMHTAGDVVRFLNMQPCCRTR